MIYTPITKTALKICFEAHKDQLDKAGAPYVFHPFHLAEQMDTEDDVCVARLDAPGEADFARVSKYAQALDLLEAAE